MITKNHSLINLDNQAYKACDNDFKVEIRKNRVVLKKGRGIRTILGFLEYFGKDVEFIITNKKDNCRHCNSENVVYNGTDSLKVNKHENFNVFV
jgi:hypothetical protein